MAMRIFLSLLDVPPAQYTSILEKFDPLIDGYHIDLCDGSFVATNNLSATPLAFFQKYSTLPLWVHFMGYHVESYLSQQSFATGTLVSFHLEAITQDGAPLFEKLISICDLISTRGQLCSLAISPTTPLSTLVPLLPLVQHQLHHLLLMSVTPGTSGQPMIPHMPERFREFSALRKNDNGIHHLGLDGGITPQTLALFAPNLPDDIAVGSSLTQNDHPLEIITRLRALAQN